MRKLLFTLLLAVAVLSLASLPAYASTPVEVSGEIDYWIDAFEMVQRGPNLFLYGSDHETWTGDIAGEVLETEFVVRRWLSNMATFESVFEFEATVLGSDPGTLMILLQGQQAAGEDWVGTWVILSGTGSLANAHGQGTWEGPGTGAAGPDLVYSGQVHFDP